MPLTIFSAIVPLVASGLQHCRRHDQGAERRDPVRAIWQVVVVLADPAAAILDQGDQAMVHGQAVTAARDRGDRAMAIGPDDQVAAMADCGPIVLVAVIGRAGLGIVPADPATVIDPDDPGIDRVTGRGVPATGPTGRTGRTIVRIEIRIGISRRTGATIVGQT